MQENRITPYTLRLDAESSLSFYSTVERTTDMLLQSVPDSVYHTIKAFQTFVTEKKCPAIRSSAEYLVELLMAGIFWHNYNGASQHTSVTAAKLLKLLYTIRQKIPFLKKPIDTIRGYGITSILFHRNNKNQKALFNLRSLYRLITYLEASGDFAEEMKRLQHWYSFLKKSTPKRRTEIINQILLLSNTFSKLSSESLSQYTQHVDAFISNHAAAYINRENRLFVTRRENEYHLNMICAEILNRAFKEEFVKTAEKIVLLPTCMQHAPAQCRSITNTEGERTCTLCTPKCSVYQLTVFLQQHGVQTRLIPHSSQFSAFLKKWRNNKDVGLVGVACVLNLIKGGYEMRKLGIPSQCVFLDYSGCRNHWHSTGIATSLNIKRLMHILGIQTETAV